MSAQAPNRPDRSGDDMDPRALIGYDVEAVDGHVGRVSDATEKVDDDHLVVRTGRVHHKDVVVELDAVRDVDEEQHVIELGRVREWVTQSPKLKNYLREREEGPQHRGPGGGAPLPPDPVV